MLKNGLLIKIKKKHVIQPIKYFRLQISILELFIKKKKFCNESGVRKLLAKKVFMNNSEF